MKSITKPYVLAGLLAVALPVSAQPVTGTYNSSHSFTGANGYTSTHISISYRGFNKSVALSACDYHCQTEYLSLDRNNSAQGGVYKSLEGNFLLPVNHDQWLYVTATGESRLLTLESVTRNDQLYSYSKARKTILNQFSHVLAAE